MGRIVFRTEKLLLDNKTYTIPKCPCCNSLATTTIHTLIDTVDGYSLYCPFCGKEIKIKNTFEEAIEEWSRIGEPIGDCEYYENHSGGRCLGTKETDCVSCRGDRKNKHCVYYKDFNKD